MPKILEKDINEKYFEKYLLTTITPDGTVIAIEKGKYDGLHGDAFLKLIKEMEKVLGIKMAMKPKDGLYENLKEFVKSNMIPISTIKIEQSNYELSKDTQIILFPKNVKSTQFKSMKKILRVFDKIGSICFNEEGIKNEDEQNGLDNLKKYIDSKIREFDGR